MVSLKSAASLSDSAFIVKFVPKELYTVLCGLCGGAVVSIISVLHICVGLALT